ncbi:MAG TPA: diacylglycerol kinase family protein [Pyrinomonadaceae bacterium]|nr:diacylglycerol kinase family protein [Pyrinomonadaceae bacterium]
MSNSTERRRAVLISNPNAGRGGARRARAVARFCDSLRGRGVGVEVWDTSGPGDAALLASRAVSEGVREVIVSGGDGTVNEALQGLAGGGARLAVWPAGTANVLARELRLPFDPDGAAEVVARGRTLEVTLGRATPDGDDGRERERDDPSAREGDDNPARAGAGRYFVLMAGIGLDATVVERVQPGLKRRVGEAAFWYSGLSYLARWRPVEFTVEADGETFAATFAAVGKAPHYGGNLSITPRARLDADEFEVCLVNSHSRLHYLRLLTHAMRGGVAGEMRDVRFLRTPRLRALGDAPVQADGELIGRLPMTFEVVRERLTIVV